MQQIKRPQTEVDISDCVSIGSLLTAIDRTCLALNETEFEKFIIQLTKNLLQSQNLTSERLQQLEEDLRVYGWGIVDKQLIQLNLFDPTDLRELPDPVRSELTKAATRFHAGDLSGALTCACGAIEIMTAALTAADLRGELNKASFQERCNTTVKNSQVLRELENQLSELGWEQQKLEKFVANFKGTLNQSFYVMQTLRTEMGDVHGTKPASKTLVFNSLKWAEILLHTLNK